jgi:uncharacterized protein
MVTPTERDSERISVAGPVGRIEVLVDYPGSPPRGIALIAHPHPLYGGTLDNKVVQTLAKTFVELGYIAARPNFRGVGATDGEHDRGGGETDDLAAVARTLRAQHGELPIVLAGFSFGAFVQTRVAKLITPERIVLVGLAAGAVGGNRAYATETVPADSILIHGEVDETVPLANLLDWARPQELPIVVVPGCDHFFHRKLHLIRAIIMNAWRS